MKTVKVTQVDKNVEKKTRVWMYSGLGSFLNLVFSNARPYVIKDPTPFIRVTTT